MPELGLPTTAPPPPGWRRRRLQALGAARRAIMQIVTAQLHPHPSSTAAACRGVHRCRAAASGSPGRAAAMDAGHKRSAPDDDVGANGGALVEAKKARTDGELVLSSKRPEIKQQVSGWM